MTVYVIDDATGEKIPPKGGPGRPFVMSHLKTGAGLAQIIDDIETKGLLKDYRIGARLRSALTAPSPIAAPKRLANRSATLSCGV